MKPNFLRHSGWVGTEDLIKTLVVIGCGAVGSHVALFAAKMGFTNFVLFDADVVEAHNLPNQTYEPSHIGMKKVEALQAVIQRFNPEAHVTVYDRFFVEADASLLKGFVVIATDSMKSRKTIIEAATLNTDLDGLFEARLGFDYGEVNIVNPLKIEDCTNFSNGLVDDNLVPDGPCNLRICTTLVGLISAYLVHMMCSAISDQKQNLEWNYKRKSIFSLTQNFQHLAR